MKIRRYTCKDMQEALLKVKMDLGSEAVIMNSKKVKPKGLLGLFAKPMIEVVAAIDDDYVKPSRPSYQRQAQGYAAYSPHQPSEPQPAVREQKPEAHMPYDNNIPETKAKQAGNSGDDPKLIELENKVKSMESMLERIYKAVGKEDAETDKGSSVKGTPPSVSSPSATSSASVNASAAKPSPTTEPISNSMPLINTAPVSSPVPNAVPSATPSLGTVVPNEGYLTVLKDILFEHDVEPKLIEKILDKIRERGGRTLSADEVFNLASRVMTVLLGEPEPLIHKDKKPQVVIFLGPTGVGKTTTLAKIAADFTLNRQKKVGLITADTYRIAAVEQLKTYAEILNLQVTVVYSPNEIKDAIERLSDNDLILIDTAGRSHKNKAQFDELKTLVTAANADETYLVVSCNTSRAAIREILEYYAFIRNYKLIFTKLDESPVPGIILNARYMTGKPLSYTTAGQSVPDDLDIANIKQLVANILGKGSM